MGSQPLDTDQHRQDASRGGSSSGGSPGHKKAKPQGAAELPQGGVSGLEQGGGVEEVEGAALGCQADHGERSLCKTLDVEQVDLQLQPWGTLRLSPGQGVYLGNHPAMTLYKDHHI